MNVKGIFRDLLVIQKIQTAMIYLVCQNCTTFVEDLDVRLV